jgi:dipeptidyl-peptidase-4
MLTEPGSGLAAGAAGGVPSDFALYDTHYTERFMGTPQTAAEAYRAGALLPRAKDLHGPLMLLHGLSDDNVVVSNFTALASELQRNGKLFETVVYPGMAHVPRGADKQIHMWRSYLDFFARRMPESAK